MRFLLLVLAAPFACAAATVFSVPSAGYLGTTQVVSFSAPDEAMLDSITDGILSIAFSSSMRASTVGNNWASWGSPPDTESATPRVLWSGLDNDFNPILSVTFTFNKPVTTFGFEAQPDVLSTFPMSADFYLAGVLQQTVTRDVDGDGGALLFALQADPGRAFDSVIFHSDVDWAAGQFRYATGAVPEPYSVVLATAGLIFIFLRKKS